jgi:transposase-like protein
VLSYVSTDAYRGELVEGRSNAPGRSGACGSTGARLAMITDQYSKSVSMLVGCLEETAETTPSCYVIDDPQARMRLRSTEGVEPEPAWVRRRTGVVRILPRTASLIRLTPALAIERNEELSERRYLNTSARSRTGEEPGRQERWPSYIRNGNHRRPCT